MASRSLFHLVVLLASVILADSQEVEQCRENVDIGFVMDSSGSIGNRDYLKEKDFVKKLASTFVISPQGSQAGIIIYSDHAQIEASFGQYPDIESFKRAVDNLPYLRRRTRIDKALKLASEKLFTRRGGTRPGKPHMMIILTDGQQTLDPDAVPLVEAVRPLHEAGVRVFAIGVGTYYNKTELRLLVKHEEDIFEASDFDNLLHLVQRIAQGTCERVKPTTAVAARRCRYRADMGFLMDASGSIGIPDFQKERNFVKDLATSFSLNETLIGVISYSDDATLEIPFTRHRSADSFRRAVDRIPYTLGRTRIDKAIKLAISDLFTSRGGSRINFPKVLVILTDGVQTPDPDAVTLDKAVIPLRKEGVKVFVVGVGSQVDRDELLLMVEEEDDLFTATDFDDLLRKTHEISERTCEDVRLRVVDGNWGQWNNNWSACSVICEGGIQTRRRVCDNPIPANGGQPCPGPDTQVQQCNQQSCTGSTEQIKCTYKADLGFLMDTSASIGKYDFQKERDFVKLLATSFTFAERATLVGVIAYSDDATLEIPFGRYVTAKGFRQAVDRIPYILGRTRIDKALKLAATDMFSTGGGSRSNHAKVLVMLTDGVQTRDPDAVPLDEAVIPLRNAGVRILVVAVGSRVDRSELLLMVEKEEDLYTATDFDDLLKKAQRISEKTCQGVREQTVDGNWSNWSDWYACSESCDGGIQVRKRTCTSPPPSKSGRFCPGPREGRRRCNEQACAGKIKCRDKSNIGFVMDASSSIGEEDFQKQRDFVKSLATSFNFASRDILAGVITYSDNAIIEIPLGQHLSANGFRQAVDRIPYTLGRTRIDKALRLASTALFNSSGGSRRENNDYPKVLVVLTDGVQTPDPDAIPLDQAVIPLRNADVHILVVGVGHRVDRNELLLMVRRAEDLFTATDFDDLLKKTHEISERTCETVKKQAVAGGWTPWREWSPCSKTCDEGVQSRTRTCTSPPPSRGGRTCPGPSTDFQQCSTQACIAQIKCFDKTDLGFIMDASGSIGRHDFQNEREFVKAVCSSFAISRGDTRVGIISYSDSASVRMYFGEYTSMDHVKTAVDRIPYTRGRTRIDKALLMADQDLFNHRSGARPGISKVAVILTDGRQTQDPDAVPLNKAVEPLRRAGVRLLAVGIGYYVDPKELRLMVERDSDVFTVKDFDDLVKRANEIALATCTSTNSTSYTTQQPTHKPYLTFKPATERKTQQPTTSQLPPTKALRTYPPTTARTTSAGIKGEKHTCGNKMDLGFAIASSADMGIANYNKQKYFVRNVAPYMDISRNGNRFGVLLYGDSSLIEVKMDYYKDARLFQNIVDILPYYSQRNRIDKALKTASVMFRVPKRVEQVSKVLVLLTFGTHTVAPGAIPLYQAVIPLRIAGVRVIVIGIGRNVSHSELAAVVENSRDVYFESTFDELLRNTDYYKKRICEAGVLRIPGGKELPSFEP